MWSSRWYVRQLSIMTASEQPLHCIGLPIRLMSRTMTSSALPFTLKQATYKEINNLFQTTEWTKRITEHKSRSLAWIHYAVLYTSLVMIRSSILGDAFPSIMKMNLKLWEHFTASIFFVFDHNFQIWRNTFLGLLLRHVYSKRITDGTMQEFFYK